MGQRTCCRHPRRLGRGCSSAGRIASICIYITGCVLAHGRGAEGACNATADIYDQFVSDYVRVVHAVGGCKYQRGCSTRCLSAHSRLRENECFIDYINTHSYLCPSLQDLGDKCGSDLAKYCQSSVNLWPRINEPQTVTVVGAFPAARKPFSRLYLRKGLATSSQGDSECEIIDQDQLQFYDGASAYDMPIESERQVDPEPAFYFSSLGANGPTLHEMKHTSSVSYVIPESFRLIQVDAEDVDVIFGVSYGGCSSSLHSLQFDETAFSLCRFSKYTGVVQTLRSWNSDWSCALSGSLSALNPVDRVFYFVVYHEATDVTSVAAVEIGGANLAAAVAQIDPTDVTARMLPIPSYAQGIVESMFYDIRNNAVFISVVDGARCTMYEIDILAHMVHYHHIGEFDLEDSATDQRYSLVSTFDSAQHDLAGEAAFPSARPFLLKPLPTAHSSVPANHVQIQRGIWRFCMKGALGSTISARTYSTPEALRIRWEGLPAATLPRRTSRAW